MKSFIQPGEYMEVTLGATLLSGAGLLVVDTFGFATKSGVSGDLVNLHLVGVHEHVKAAEAFAQGEKLYWDNTAKVLTKTASGNKLIGVAAEVALIGAAKGRVRLNGVHAI